MFSYKRLFLRLTFFSFIFLPNILFWQNCSPGFEATSYDQFDSINDSSDIDEPPQLNGITFGKVIVNESEFTPYLKTSGNLATLNCSEPTGELVENHSANISRLELNETVKNVLGINLNSSIYPDFYTTNKVTVPSNLFDSMEIVAQNISNKFIDSLEKKNNRYWSCDFKASCFNELVEKLPKYVWRKKISTEEINIIQTIVSMTKNSTENERKVGLKNLMNFLINSPQFYLKNKMPTSAKNIEKNIDIYSLASRLSFIVTFSAPSYELMSNLENNKISTVEELIEYAEFLLDNDSVQKLFVKHFLSDWLGFNDHINSNEKFNNTNVINLVNSELSRLEKIFKANEPIKNVVHDASNKGILNTKLYAFLTYAPPKHNHAQDTSIVKRGLFIMDKLLCMNPPDGLSPALEDAINAVENSPNFPHDGNNLEKAKFHRTNQACASCHFYIDNLAIGMESIGPFGNIRSKYPNNTSIDLSRDPATGDEYTIAGQSYNTTEKYTKIISQTLDLKSCFAKRIHERVLPNTERAIKPCLVNELFSEGDDTGLRDLVLNFIKSSMFQYNKKPKYQ